MPRDPAPAAPQRRVRSATSAALSKCPARNHHEDPHATGAQLKITKRHAPYTPLMCTVRAACNQVAQAVAFARTAAAPAWTSKFALAALQNRVRAKQFVAQHFCGPGRCHPDSRPRMEPRPPNAARCDPSARPSPRIPSRHAEQRPLPSLAYPRAIKTNPYGYTLHDALFPLRRIGHRAAAPTGSQNPCTLWAALGLRAQEHTDRRPHGQTQGRARLRART